MSASPDVTRLKQEVCEAIDGMRDELLRLSHAIHANPELAFEERAASALLVDAMRRFGLDVSAGAYGLETAFASEFGPDGGPCVAILAEYDALPHIGHACGHNLIAVSGVGAGLALAALGPRVPGRVRVLGTPAEEHGCGKELMAREGALDGVEAAMMMHPSGVNLANMPCIAMAELEIVYHGQAAHASAMPERGVNALDAMMIGYNAMSALRQHIGRDERVHGIVTDGGQAPNVVPERTAGRFYVRAASFTGLAPLKDRVEACFRAGATATGCEIEVLWGAADYRDFFYNAPLAESFVANAGSLGRQFFPWEKLPASVKGSTDMGNISYRVPSIHPMLACAPMHVTIHNAEFEKWAGSEQGDAAAIDGAKALAMTALDYLTDPDLRERTRAIFEAGSSA
jgi:amidohydrolase